MAHPVDLFVDQRIFLNVGVTRWDVGLRLIIIVIANKVVNRIVREQFLKFAIELGGQGFVGCQNQCWPAGLSDQVGHRESFSRAGDAEKYLMAITPLETLAELLDRPRLVTRGSKVTLEDKSIVTGIVTGCRVTGCGICRLTHLNTHLAHGVG